jgi:hypothetical protein
MALPATLGKNLPTNPFPCGAIRTVAAGTAVQAASNYTNLSPLNFRWVQLRGLDGNTGLIYVLSINGNPPWTLPSGTVTSGADTVTFLNVIQILAAGETWGGNSEQGNLIGIGSLWIDSSVSGEGVLITGYQY